MDLAAEGIGFWDWELKEGKLTISPEWMEMMGYAKEDLPDLPTGSSHFLAKAIGVWSQYVHPEDRAEAEKALMDYLIFRRDSIYNNEFRFRKSNGKYLRIFSNGYAEWDEKGNVSRFRVNHVDISDLGSFDKALLLQMRYLQESSMQSEKSLNRRLTRRLQFSVLLSAGFAIALLWVSGTFSNLWGQAKLARENIENPITTFSSETSNDVADFTVFYANKIAIEEALKAHIGVYADRAVFGYYEPGPVPTRGRIGAQAKRQSVDITISERPWIIDADPETGRFSEILVQRRDAHLRGDTFLVNNPFAGLYDAGFQISAPGFWTRPDGPAIAWFVGIECEPGRACDEDNVNIKALKNEVDQILKNR